MPTESMLTGKTALVTGSASGMGRGIAEALAGAGCNVVFNGFGDPAEIEAPRAGLAAETGVEVTYSDADMIEPGKVDDPVSWDHSYFRREPFVERGGLDYYGGGSYESEPLIWFHHGLSEVVMDIGAASSCPGGIRAQ